MQLDGKAIDDKTLLPITLLRAIEALFNIFFFQFLSGRDIKSFGNIRNFFYQCSYRNNEAISYIINSGFYEATLMIN